MLYQIKTRWTDAVIFEADVADLRAAVELAVKECRSLTYANLTDANLADANLTGANLTYANLTGAKLADANLTGAKLADANLTGANLTGANLTYANLTGANLTGAKLAYANLTGANLTYANLTGANLAGAKLTGNPIWIGPIGSRKATVLFFPTNKGVYVQTGCFLGPLDKFESAVKKTHSSNEHATAYAAALELAKLLLSQR